jgi:hypothetical protein
VAWLPFDKDDNQNNMQIFLSQCATGKEWQNKQHETTKNVHRKEFFFITYNWVLT